MWITQTDLISCKHLNVTSGYFIFISISFAVNLFLFLMSNYFNRMNSHLFVWKMKAAEFFPKYPVLTEDMESGRGLSQVNDVTGIR